MVNGGDSVFHHRCKYLTRSRPNITIVFTLVAVAVSFAWLGVEDPSKWQAGVVLYILGCKFVLHATTLGLVWFPLTDDQ